jgi:hypothetical protein
MRLSRDEVFVAGGQPSVTYVEREELHIERNLARALASPNQIVSLSGPTKSGKTVLCRRVLGERYYVWVEGGQVKHSNEIWDKICYELNVPIEMGLSDATQTEGGISIDLPFIASGSGSRLSSAEHSRTFRIDSMAAALQYMLSKKLVLVIDDFHYLDEAARLDFLRNVKGAVFNGLKVLVMSVTHRAFDAIKAESELTGRFTAITIPEWSLDDLAKIPQKGFNAMGIVTSKSILDNLAKEAQESPFLMQKFCWEVCYDMGIDLAPLELQHVPGSYDLNAMYVRLAEDAGLPIYEKLVAGPQSRKERMKRPLRTGETADVYEATLTAIAQTGPRASLSYEEIRVQLGILLLDKVPQKHEVSSALKHLSRISAEIGTDKGIDWEEDKRRLNLTDPYLRFYLRWQVRRHDMDELAF